MIYIYIYIHIYIHILIFERFNCHGTMQLSEFSEVRTWNQLDKRNARNVFAKRNMTCQRCNHPWDMK